MGGRNSVKTSSMPSIILLWIRLCLRFAYMSSIKIIAQACLLSSSSNFVNWKSQSTINRCSPRISALFPIYSYCCLSQREVNYGYLRAPGNIKKRVIYCKTSSRGNLMAKDKMENGVSYNVFIVLSGVVTKILIQWHKDLKLWERFIGDRVVIIFYCWKCDLIKVTRLVIKLIIENLHITVYIFKRQCGN